MKQLRNDTTFSQQGGLGKAHQVFGNELNSILAVLTLALIA